MVNGNFNKIYCNNNIMIIVKNI